MAMVGRSVGHHHQHHHRACLVWSSCRLCISDIVWMGGWSPEYYWWTYGRSLCFPRKSRAVALISVLVCTILTNLLGARISQTLNLGPVRFIEWNTYGHDSWPTCCSSTIRNAPWFRVGGLESALEKYKSVLYLVGRYCTSVTSTLCCELFPRFKSGKCVFGQRKLFAIAIYLS